jgi:bacterioferritin (cytochrome b1)
MDGKKKLDEEIRKYCYERKFHAMFVDGLVPVLKDFYLKHTNAMIGELFEEIKHGDEEHQEWLKTKMRDFYERQIK